MKNTKQIDTLAKLRQREAAGKADAQETYRKLVESVATSQNTKPETIEAALADAGQSVAAFEAHVKLAERLMAGRERVREDGKADYMAQLEQVGEERAVLQQERKQAEKEFEARQRELELRADRIRNQRTWAARATESLLRAEIEYAATLAGDPIPQPEPKAEPKFIVEQTGLPRAKPKEWDKYDTACTVVMGSDGRPQYMKNGRKLA